MESFVSSEALRGRARVQLSGNWGQAVGFAAIMGAIWFGISVCDGVVTKAFHLLLSPSSWIVRHDVELSLFSLFLSGAWAVSIASYALSMFDGRPSIERVEDGFRCFWKAFSAYFMFNLFVLLWMLLLIIPGIIKSYAYDMAYFIIADNPEVGPVEAITRSRKLMEGNKWRLFCLHLSFIGWGLLSILTLGIGLLWLIPYIHTSRAAFYRDVVRVYEEGIGNEEHNTTS